MSLKNWLSPVCA